ncbi:unnamed protein product [Closterium sp. Yama58-4]|nr:unnamed protein product [Closterium sp. Yama58-4]
MAPPKGSRSKTTTDPPAPPVDTGVNSPDDPALSPNKEDSNAAVNVPASAGGSGLRVADKAADNATKGKAVVDDSPFDDDGFIEDSDDEMEMDLSLEAECRLRTAIILLIPFALHKEISGIIIAVLSGAQEILTAASDYFRGIFGKDKRLDFSDWKPVRDRQLGAREAVGLDADWTEEEVQAAYASLAKNKSPGSDGMSKEFFEANWDLLGKSFMALVKDFSETAALPDAVKGAVTILLHKKGDKDQLGNYRAISLLNFTYKILAKVLAERMKKVLHRVISPDQYGFIPGRRLTDGVALVADIIDAAKNKSEDWFLLLVDFQKAFDSVSRGFIFQVLRRMGFPERFVSWVEGLHSHTTTKMLLNGWLGEGIEVVSGVRQGCPLAPYLFLCAVEPLVQDVERKKLGLEIGGERLSYLGYADDTTLALQGKQQIVRAEGILTKFAKKSGLCINVEKTVVLPLSRNRGYKAPTSSTFKWAEPDDAERMLGVWVTPDGSGLPTWEKALEEIAKRLVKWRQKYLTEKARGAVANDYIQPIMTFQAQVYPPPAKIWGELERMIHNFVSGNKATSTRGFFLWSKELLYTPRSEGGLGVRDPSITLACLAARRVGLMLTETSQLKRKLMIQAADLPLGLDTFMSHDRLLRHWEGRIAEERLVFNRAIMVGTATPVGGQKDAEPLWNFRLGDMVKRLQDGSWVLKTMEELTARLGGKGPARLALRGFAAAPEEWRTCLLTPPASSAGSTPGDWRRLPQLPILRDGGVIPLKEMRSH